MAQLRLPVLWRHLQKRETRTMGYGFVDFPSWYFARFHCATPDSVPTNMGGCGILDECRPVISRQSNTPILPPSVFALLRPAMQITATCTKKAIERLNALFTQGKVTHRNLPDPRWTNGRPVYQLPENVRDAKLPTDTR